MSLHIRLFADADYPAIIAVYNAVYPANPTSADEYRYGDQHRPPHCRWQRWVAEQAGQVIAFAQFSQRPDEYHPQKFWMLLLVDPAHDSTTVRDQLFATLLSALQPFDPLELRAPVREDIRANMAFYARQGFKEEMRLCESVLDVTGFDATPYTALAESLAAQAITIHSVRDLAADSAWQAKLYALETELEHDVPRLEPLTPMSYDEYLANTLDHPNALHDGYFVAIHQGEYIGVTSLFARQAQAGLEIGLTGVKRGYRRRGIALALKLQGIAFAQTHGYQVLKTWNESRNQPMIALNERLGFRNQPAWIDFLKILQEAPA